MKILHNMINVWNRHLFPNFQMIEAANGDVLYKKGVLRTFAKFTGKHLCQCLFLMKLQAKACNFIKKETLAQVFSCEFWESFKNTFSYRTALSTFSYSGCFWNEETSSIHSLKKRKVLSIVFFMTMFNPKLC